MLDIRLADARIVTFSYAYFARMDLRRSPSIGRGSFRKGRKRKRG
jgi:hypothetical protein